METKKSFDYIIENIGLNKFNELNLSYHISNNLLIFYETKNSLKLKNNINIVTDNNTNIFETDKEDIYNNSIDLNTSKNDTLEIQNEDNINKKNLNIIKDNTEYKSKIIKKIIPHFINLDNEFDKFFIYTTDQNLLNEFNIMMRNDKTIVAGERRYNYFIYSIKSNINMENIYYNEINILTYIKISEKLYQIDIIDKYIIRNNYISISFYKISKMKQIISNQFNKNISLHEFHNLLIIIVFNHPKIKSFAVSKIFFKSFLNTKICAKKRVYSEIEEC